MKSPFIKVLVVALVLAGVTFVITPLFELSNISVSLLVLVAAVIAQLFHLSAATAEINDIEIKTLYVGNLPYRANESMVKELFEQYGYIQSVRLMKDKHTGKRRGFGFVEISANDANKAIDALNDTEFQQRTLKVREAKDKPET